MTTITMRISDDLNHKLEKITQTTERSKSYILRKALVTYLQDIEDYREAIDILSQNNQRYSLTDVERKLGLDH